MPQITLAPNLLRKLFRRVYFITGTAYAGKSTVVRLLAEKYGGVHCGENYHDVLMSLCEPAHQPDLCYFDTMSGWQEFISRTPEEYDRWVTGVSREAAQLEMLRLIHLTQQDPERPVFVDTNIPLDMLREIAPEGHVLVMLSPQSMSVTRFFDRPDPEKQFLLRQIQAAPDPDAAMDNFLACIARCNSPEHYAECERSGFPLHIRRDTTTLEEALHRAETVFGLNGKEDPC